VDDFLSAKRSLHDVEAVSARRIRTFRARGGVESVAAHVLGHPVAAGRGDGFPDEFFKLALTDAEKRPVS
jgi:hypothetical protein